MDFFFFYCFDYLAREGNEMYGELAQCIWWHIRIWFISLTAHQIKYYFKVCTCKSYWF